MIILVNPMWSVEHLNKDSNYVHIKKIIERFTQLYPDTYFIVPFPSRHFKYYEDGLFQNPNVVRVPYVIPLAKKINNITFDGAFFNRVVEQYGVGLIYNQIPEVTGQLKSLDSHFSSTIPIINQHHYIYHDSLPYPLENQMQYVYWQILGDVLADVNIYNSKYTLKMVKENVTKYMPNFLPDIEKKAKVLYMGFYDKKHSYNKNKFKKFTFMYNHRLQQYKNWADTFAMFDFLSNNYDFEVALCPVGPSNITPINKKPYTKVYEVKTEVEYYDVLSKCHCNTYNSQYETFCISIFESMMFGLATIVPDATTMPELLGKGNPQLFKGKKEQTQKVKALLKDPQQAHIFGIDNIKRAQKFDIDLYCRQLNDVFEEQFNKYNMYASLKERNKEKLQKYIDRHDKISVYDMKKIRRYINLSNQSVPNHRLTNIMQHAGYKHIIENDKAYFVKT